MEALVILLQIRFDQSFCWLLCLCGCTRRLALPCFPSLFGKRGRRSRSSTYSQAFGGIDLRRRVIAEALMLPFLVVEARPAAESRPLLRQRAHRRAAARPHTSGCAAAAAGRGAGDNPTRSVRPSSWHATRRINSLSRGVSPQGGAALQSRSSSLSFAQVQPPLDAVNSAIHLWRRICVAA